LQIAVPLPALTTGAGLTLTVTVALLLQPERLLPVTVYTVVVIGLAVALEPVVDDKPEDGIQV
jgi:hypothetical protein